MKQQKQEQQNSSDQQVKQVEKDQTWEKLSPLSQAMLDQLDEGIDWEEIEDIAENY